MRLLSTTNPLLLFVLSTTSLAACLGSEPALDDLSSDPAPALNELSSDPPPAFRFTALQLRDPHMVGLPGCLDATLLVNYFIDQALPSTDASILQRVTPRGTGTCLAPLPGTTRSTYRPSVPSVIAPCVATDEVDVLPVTLGPVDVPLRHARIAARRAGTRLVGGLLRGFLAEADADAIVLPPGMPPEFEGKRLGELLPGGRGACARYTDVDVLDGERGWWMYLAVEAEPVTTVAR